MSEDGWTRFGRCLGEIAREGTLPVEAFDEVERRILAFVSETDAQHAEFVKRVFAEERGRNA